ncbi:MAG: methyltransferase domain-containing protein [bacterium]|nr:methyltransferase domain-containing protein [bacterium]
MSPASGKGNPDIGAWADLLSEFVLDVRSPAAFAAGHLRGAASHPWPGDAGARPGSWLSSVYLPPRHEPLLVTAGDAASLAAVLADLRGRERLVQGLVLDRPALATCPPTLLAVGPDSGVLWRPPPWLEDHADLLPPAILGPAVDLGCGSGRAAVWLARRGYDVTGIDHQPEALELGRLLAADAGRPCRFVAADLRPSSAWPPGPWALLLNFRFLLQDMLAEMAGRLQPGGVAVVRTFRDAPGWTGPPRRRHRLERGELLRIFDRGRFEVLAHAEDFDGDGRPAAGIVARRRIS